MAADPRHLDDLSPGDRFEAGATVVAQADIDAFAELSGDRTALHTDPDYARTTPHEGIIAHGALVLAIATGHAYEIGVFEGTILAVRSMEVAFLRPVRPGDALTTHFEVVEVEADPPVDRGSATFRVDVRNQGGRRVLKGRWDMLMRRRSPPGGA